MDSGGNPSTPKGISFFTEIFIETILDSHAVVTNNIEISQFPSGNTLQYYIVQYHNWSIAMDTTHLSYSDLPNFICIHLCMCWVCVPLLLYNLEFSFVHVFLSPLGKGPQLSSDSQVS